VVVTRPEPGAGELRRRLEELGARVLVVPAICFESAGDEAEWSALLEALPGVAWIAFASANGVRFFARRLDASGAALPPGARLAAVGPGTAAEARQRLRPPALVAAVSTAEGLAEALIARARPGEGEILLPSAERGRRVLEERLGEAGFTARRLVVYRTRTAEAADGAVEIPPAVDYVLFTSPSTVRGFLARSRMPAGAEAVSIGPTTTREARAAGLGSIREARRHDLEGLVEVLG
jgi:uroporphyrinogen-III synthase